MAEAERVEIGVREFRADLSGFLRQARQGKSFVVVSHGEPVAEINPPSAALRRRRPVGLLRGRIRMAEDFDVLPEDVLDAMEGGEG